MTTDPQGWQFAVEERRRRRGLSGRPVLDGEGAPS